MDDTEDGTRYPPNLYGGNHSRAMLPTRGGVPYPRPVDTDNADDEEEDETDDDEELGDEEEYNNGQNGYPSVHKGVRDDDHEDDSDDEEDEDDEEDNKMMVRRLDDDDLKTHPKKRKLKSLISSYEFAHRLPAPLPLLLHLLLQDNQLVVGMHLQIYLNMLGVTGSFNVEKRVFALRSGKRFQTKYQRCPRLKGHTHNAAIGWIC
ncbi:hypothetical protein DVH24_000162 [Malus domestica]|uniref:Uncharacterized protein n=1 Tax=Malus domestica TaxID=3750 RepID=A0A498J3Y8_MALDO|nr:hypothetical protein DVH24_000162 [Malus domestica]